jgi:hypothetical protein
VSESILRKPANQEVVSALLDAVGAYFRDLCPYPERCDSLQEIRARAEAMCSSPGEALGQVLSALPELRVELIAMCVLGQISDAVAIPIFAKSDAIGTVMRKKLEPVTAPIFGQIAVLRAAGRP